MHIRTSRLLLTVLAVAALSLGCGSTAELAENTVDEVIEEVPVPTTDAAPLPERWSAPRLPELPPTALAYLFDEHPWLALDLVNQGLFSLLNDDPYLPDHVLRYLHDSVTRDGDTSSSALDDIFRHPNVPPDLLTYVATDFYGEHWYLSEVLLHPHLPEEAILTILRADPAIAGRQITALLASRPGLPEEELRRLSKTSPSEEIRDLATDRLWEIARATPQGEG